MRRALTRWPRRILHFKRPRKALENSLRGVAYAHAHGYDGVDFDLRCTADGVVVGSHDSDPNRWDRFVDPRGIIPRGTPIESLTWAQVSRLRTPDGLRIRRVERLLRACARLELVAVLEPKTRAAGTDAVWAHIRKVADRVRCRVVAYALRSHGGRVTMAAARRHGIPGKVLRG